MIDILKIKHIALIRTGGIGNMILFLPVIRTLRNLMPKVYIAVYCETGGARDILESSGLVNKVIQLDIPRIRKTYLTRFLFMIRLIFSKRYDLSIVSYTGLGLFFNSIMPLALRAKHRIGYLQLKSYQMNNYRVHFQPDIHEIEYNLNLLKPLGLDPNNAVKNHSIHVPERMLIWRDNYLREIGFNGNTYIVGIHPGSGYSMRLKRWPIDHFQALVRSLCDYQQRIKILVFGGSDDQDLSGQFSQCVSDNRCVDLIGKTSLFQTAALIQKCNYFISNDSGLMHIADALNVPVLGIFGPTMHYKNAPSGKKASFIRIDLECSPCYTFQDPTLNCTNPDYQACLKNISVDAVYRRILPCLELTKH